MARRASLRWTRLGTVALLASCASSGVQVARSDRTPPPAPTTTTPATTTSVPTTTTSTTATSATTGATTGTTTGPSFGSIDWSACSDEPAPYECGTVEVPLDYADPGGDHLSLALIRLPAGDPSTRIGSLVVNPGGPGGSGIDLVTGESDQFPSTVLDRFDLVGFDPRGVGASSPVRCPASFDADDSSSYDACLPANLDVLPFLGTPNVARDMDMIRQAVGDTQLTYLGYSYGTALGAVYADLFPDNVRAMVLDGAVDPDAGESNTPTGGSDFYADQDFDGTIAAFERLCDASPVCAAGPHSADLLERVRTGIRNLPTSHFPASASPLAGALNKSDVDDLMVNAMYSSFDWPILAVALEDADNGDASTVAALYSWLLYGYPADVSAQDDEQFANIAVRCADFADRGSNSYECADFPDSAGSLPVITAVDTPNPILVVGTKDDPATPAHYAPAMASALGDAVAIEWEGAGHTATLTSRCVTDLVATYLVEAVAPANGSTCPFATGATTLAEQGAAVFAAPDPEVAADSLIDVLTAAGNTASAAGCVADQLVRRGDERLVVHELLGVESPELVALRNVIEAHCASGG
ncbi:MAG: putative tripeptidylaminopeptidase [Acidimicrobiales bacterium]|nr:putative tripeptidylaminopeptidase [Acidimicrobiales bacterium]